MITSSAVRTGGSQKYTTVNAYPGTNAMSILHRNDIVRIYDGIINKLTPLNQPVLVNDTIDRDQSLYVSKMYGQFRIRNETNRKLWLWIYTLRPKRDYTDQDFVSWDEVPDICMDFNVADGETVEDSPGGNIDFYQYGMEPWMFPKLGELFRVGLLRKLVFNPGELKELRYKMKGFRYDRFEYENYIVSDISIMRREVGLMFRFYSEPITYINNADPPLVLTMPTGPCEFSIVHDKWMKMYSRNVIGAKSFYFAGQALIGGTIVDQATQIVDTSVGQTEVIFGVGPQP